MLKARLNFTRDQLGALLKRALLRWNADIGNDQLRLNVEEKTGRASVSINVRNAVGKSVTVYLGHEAIVGAIAEASAAEGNPIKAETLEFKHIAGSGYSGGSSCNASAEPGTASDPAKVTPGKIQFPGTVSVSFGKDELLALLKKAVERSGQTPGYISTYYTEGQGCSATIAVKMPGHADGSISLTGSQTDEAIIEELTAQGYDVEPGGISYTQTASGFGGSGGTSMRATLRSIPVR